MTSPIPQGTYLSAVRHNDLVYTSGMTPRHDGRLLYSGKIKCDDLPDQHRSALELAASNALAAIQQCLTDDECIRTVLQLTVYLNAENGFVSHPKVADLASEYLLTRLGPNSIGSRAAIGAATLPSDSTVEISLIASITTIEVSRCRL
jgi:enamine deaminase RidA (YjgF/YER057c/UK114 family)